MTGLKIVGLCGFARVGKDTAAANMPEYRRFAFADRLKTDLIPLLLHVGCDLSDPEHKERARGLLVAWGATARAFSPEYWIDRLFEDIDDWSFETFISGKVVISDVRYQNEVDAILSRGGKVVRITRPGHGPANDEEARSFAEISGLPEVINDGAPADLGRRVLEVVG